MGYWCWLEACRSEIPGGDEVWMDVHGNTVTWERGTIPESPAAYHPDCAVKWSLSKPGWTEEDLVKKLPAPRGTPRLPPLPPLEPPKGQTSLF